MEMWVDISTSPMWIEISAGLLIALVLVVIRYERRERMAANVMRGNVVRMVEVLTERRKSTTEPPVPGQGKML